MDVTRDNLNSVMEFDHVIRVQGDGTVTDAEPDVWAPNLYDGELESSSKWALMKGWSGQDRYFGPIMHDSEYIGGRMADAILETPGLYVAIVCYYLGDAEADEIDSEGWAVAYITDDGSMP